MQKWMLASWAAEGQDPLPTWLLRAPDADQEGDVPGQLVPFGDRRGVPGITACSLPSRLLQSSAPLHL